MPSTMSPEEFSALLRRLAAAAEAADGEAFAACFTPDGIYHDYIFSGQRQTLIAPLRKPRRKRVWP